MRKCANISLYMERALVTYDFATAPFWISLYTRVWGKFDFLLYQCTWLKTWKERHSTASPSLASSALCSWVSRVRSCSSGYSEWITCWLCTATVPGWRHGRRGTQQPAPAWRPLHSAPGWAESAAAPQGTASGSACWLCSCAWKHPSL